MSLVPLELLALLCYISSENRCTCFTQTSHQSFFWWQKNSENLHFLGYFSKAKTEQSDQKKLSLSDNFGMLISGLDTFFLEVRARALLKVATETSFSGKNSEHLAFLGYFFRSKNGGKWLLFFFIILEHSYLVQIHAFWKSMHEFL